MDDALGVVFGVFFAGLFGLCVGLITYENGANAIKEQAIAANVACYKTEPTNGKTSFMWNCQKEIK